jgi:FkbH-like protein
MYTAGDWREPASADFAAKLKWAADELREGTDERADVAKVIRRLAAMRVPLDQRSRLQRLGKRSFAVANRIPGYRPLRMLAVGNRTLDFLAVDLAAAGLARGLAIELVSSGFDATASLALGAEWQGPAGPFDAVFLMLDAAAFAEAAPLLDQTEAEARNERAVARLARIANGLKSRLNVPLFVATLAQDSTGTLTSSDGGMPGAKWRLVSAINQSIHVGGQQRHWVVWDFASLAERIGTYALSDPVGMHLAKTPYALACGPAVADSLAAKLAAFAGKAGRALVLDLDNTLWGGVVADDGIEGLRLGQGSAEGEAYTAFQKLMLEFRGRGIVLAVCSKNLDAIAREPFKSHPDMLLKEGHMAAFIANFDDKATNISRIARQLDLGPESLVFIDDNPAERERVRSELPFVHVPEVPEDVSYFPHVVLDAGYFDQLPLTIEDLGRSDAYVGRAKASAALEEIGNYDDYLKSLEMKISVKPFDATGRARIAQLISKSNQFNLTTRRYSENDVERLAADQNFICMQVRLKDKFADHGMISVVIVDKTDAEAWGIDTWLMSCRVLKRGVEQCLMNHVFALAAEADAHVVQGVFIPTPRNGLVADFFDHMTFENTSAGTLLDKAVAYAKPVSAYVPFQCYMEME